MAGGRRPANYVSGARYNPGVDRGTTNAAQQEYAQAEVTYAPPWMPSIWDGADKRSNGRQQAAPNTPGEATSAIAVALETAVQSAVQRALGSRRDGMFAPTIQTGYEREDGNVVTSTTGVTMSQGRERELLNAVKDLESRVVRCEAELERKDELLKKNVRMMEQMEQMVRQTQRRQDETNGRLKTVLSKVSTSEEVVKDLTQGLRVVSDDCQRLEEAQNAVGDELKVEMRGELRDDMKVLHEGSVSRCERMVKEAVKTMQDEIAQCKMNMQRELETQAEKITTNNRHAKTQLNDVSKQVRESAELTSGFEKSLQASMQDGQQKSHKNMKALEDNVSMLKKLIESNLRTQWNAENIVKEQVSLITKHVCVAMRQYTTRRIAENNRLIDQALRARVSEYANSDEDQQCVLVRQHFPDGNESIDIQNMASNITANPSSEDIISSSLSSSSTASSISSTSSCKK